MRFTTCSIVTLSIDRKNKTKYYKKLHKQTIRNYWTIEKIWIFSHVWFGLEGMHFTQRKRFRKRTNGSTKILTCLVYVHYGIAMEEVPQHKTRSPANLSKHVLAGCPRKAWEDNLCLDMLCPRVPINSQVTWDLLESRVRITFHPTCRLRLVF